MTTAEMTPADYAAINGGGNRNGIFGGDGAWFLIILFLFAFMGWGGNNGGSGAGNYAIPFGYATSTVTQSDVQRGFDQTALVGKLDTINASVANGFANAEVSRCNAQTNLLQTLNGISMAQQNCCCENRAAVADLKYTVATENCADRAALSDGIRDVITASTANTQAILDKLCNMELDGLKERNAALQAQVQTLQLAQSQTAQNGFIAETATGIVNALRQPAPIPAYVVANPSCCQQQNYGCGCSGAF